METALIYQKLPLIMKDIAAIGKNKTNTSQGWKFRGVDDVYNMMHPILAKHCVTVVPRVLEINREERPTKSGGISIVTILKVEYTFFAEDGSFFTAVTAGEAADSGDKSTAKAMSIAHKYLFFQTFAIPTEDIEDPDKESVEFKPDKNKDLDLREKKFNKLIESFRPLGVSSLAIKNKFKIKDGDLPSDKQLDEMTQIGRSIKNDKKPVSEFFDLKPNVNGAAK